MIKVKQVESSALSSETVNTLAGSSLFASPGFLDVWRSIGGQPGYWLLEVDRQPVALLPVVHFGKTVLKRGQSLPDGCYGGVYAASARIPIKEASAIFAERLANGPYARLLIYDFHNHFAGHSAFKRMPHSTSLVDISDPGWQPSDPKVRSEIRKAEREGIEVVPFDSTRHLSAFVRLMEETERRHGRHTKYPPAFFEALAELAINDSRVTWLWCEHDGRGAASHINFREGDMAINWQVYFDKEFSFLKPNQYMLYTYACQQAAGGATTLNLGASPPDAESLKDYKAKWGGTDHEYQCLGLLRGLGRVLCRPL